MRNRNFPAAVTVLGVSLALSLSIAAGPLARNAEAQANQPGATATPAQVQQPQEGGVNWPGAGYGVGALFANVLYVPAKLVYAVAGGLIGGGAYAVTGGNKQAADTVWRSSLGGDYVVTPQMLTGQQPINFSGPTETPPEPPAVSANPGSGMNTNSSYGSVAPIAPIPSSGNYSTAPSASYPTSASGRPLDRGTGPAGSSSGLPNSSIE